MYNLELEKAVEKINKEKAKKVVIQLPDGIKIKGKEIPDNLKDHGLFIGFSPFDNPKIALAIIVENGESGRTAAAPIAKKILDVFLDRERT